MIPSGRQLEIETRARLQDDLWSSTTGYQGDFSLEPHEANWIATIGAGILFFLIGLMVIQISYSIGIFFVLIGVVVVGGAISVLKAEGEMEFDEDIGDQWAQMETEREWEDAARARQEARQKEIDEIVKAVKSTIRVRCRYCGTLNEETANKCESCGASL